MKAAKFLGLAVLTVAVSGIAQAAPTSKVRVVAGATALSTTDKASVTGLGPDWKATTDCGCSDLKPGYGFGAKVEHFGPPGQGFGPFKTWRGWMRGGEAPYGDFENTPAGHPLPPRAYDLYLTNP